MKTCVLCNKEFTEYGNNPFPLAEDGQCCNWCDDTKVIPARLEKMGYTNEMAQAIGKQIHHSRSYWAVRGGTKQ